MPLTDTRLRALKPKDKPYKVTDERGLYVEVTPTGGKLWRFRYRIGGAQKKLCIGSYPDISLKQARDAPTRHDELLLLAAIRPLRSGSGKSAPSSFLHRRSRQSHVSILNR